VRVDDPIFIKGEKIELRPFDSRDLSIWAFWGRDEPEIAWEKKGYSVYFDFQSWIRFMDHLGFKTSSRYTRTIIDYITLGSWAILA
jgi:hypothetical protein